MPALVSYQDSLILPVLMPGVDWDLRSFYPSEGTHLDQIGNYFYSLETHFSYFGLAADFDQFEMDPPHYYLPNGWQSKEMVSLEWQKPQGWQIVREPTIERGHLYAYDPGAEGDSSLVNVQVDVRGSYQGHKDQVFRFEYRTGEHFIGDQVLSPVDSSRVLWDVSNYMNDPLYPQWDPDTLLANLAEGDTLVSEVQVAWSEVWGTFWEPDGVEGQWGAEHEFNFAPGDSLLTGTIFLRSSYTKTGGEIEMTESNHACAHELSRGLWVSFNPGILASNYTSEFVTEDFEGFHVWRRVNGETHLDGRPRWWNTWSLSKTAETDKFYWWWIDYYRDPSNGFLITFDWDTLTPVFGDTEERLFLDFDVHNGFYYEYALTTYDRGFRPMTGEHDHTMIESTLQEDLATVLNRIEFDLPAAEDLDRWAAIYAVPNPLRTGKSATENPNYHNYPGNVVRFVGLTDTSTLRVYTQAGDLLFEGENRNSDTRNLVWDTRNLSRELVASGVYVYRAEDSETGQEFYGLLTIIR
ncbi:MAG: hypothetical protein QF492_04125 [Candidatus Krumholzibacteria bacterium]|nr:hypothetical protein [Candidatus Krumholzibacteria bacterium]MDP6797333.1 hypothetical protein [Candidatus Krumholzibacteria bacterium]